MPDAAQLRDLAARMLALAMNAEDQRWLEQLCVRAGEYLDQATALESAAPQATVQQAQQPQSDKKDVLS
jgi:hypothetical protein